MLKRSLELRPSQRTADALAYVLALRCGWFQRSGRRLPGMTAFCPAPQSEAYHLPTGFRTEPYLKWVILGQASLRIVTPEGKVIYVDLYTGTADDYSLPADLIKQRSSPLDSSFGLCNQNGGGVAYASCVMRPSIEEPHVGWHTKEVPDNYCVRLARPARAQTVGGGGSRTGGTATDDNRRMCRAGPPDVCSN